MAEVMLGKKQAGSPVHTRVKLRQLLDQHALLKQFLLQPQRQRVPERGKPARRKSQVSLEQAFELEKGLVVERHEIDFVRPQPGKRCLLYTSRCV